MPFELTDWFTGLLGSPFGAIVGNVINVVVFLVKGFSLVTVMMWVRWTLPRLRIDQVMMTCLKYLLPISCALLLGVSLWHRAMPPQVLGWLRYGLAGVCVFFVFLMFWKAWSLRGTPLSGGMPPLYREAPWPEFGALKKT